jgi:hypothetical protein
MKFLKSYLSFTGTSFYLKMLLFSCVYWCVSFLLKDFFSERFISILLIAGIGYFFCFILINNHFDRRYVRLNKIQDFLQSRALQFFFYPLIFCFLFSDFEVVHLTMDSFHWIHDLSVTHVLLTTMGFFILDVLLFSLLTNPFVSELSLQLDNQILKLKTFLHSIASARQHKELGQQYRSYSSESKPSPWSFLEFLQGSLHEDGVQTLNKQKNSEQSFHLEISSSISLSHLKSIFRHYTLYVIVCLYFNLFLCSNTRFPLSVKFGVLFVSAIFTLLLSRHFISFHLSRVHRNPDESTRHIFGLMLIAYANSFISFVLPELIFKNLSQYSSDHFYIDFTQFVFLFLFIFGYCCTFFRKNNNASLNKTPEVQIERSLQHVHASSQSLQPQCIQMHLPSTKKQKGTLEKNKPNQSMIADFFSKSPREFLHENVEQSINLVQSLETLSSTDISSSSFPVVSSHQDLQKSSVSSKQCIHQDSSFSCPITAVEGKTLNPAFTLQQGPLSTKESSHAE